MDPDSEVAFDFQPYLCQYKSGRVFRLGGDPTVPAGTDPVTRVVSRDIHAGAARARVYLPPGAAVSTEKLPVVVYFHGGGFVTGSPARPSTHAYLNDLVARAGAIGVSVYYRLAPENPLPAAYEDAWAAVRWAATRGDGADPWLLDHADLSRLFLAGCSAGANIAHNMAAAAIPCERVQVCVAEQDVLLKERGLWYHRELKASGYGGEVELFESKGVGHAFHFVGMAGSDQAVELLERNVEFIKK
jgi:acetyl esterase/lipase